MALFNMKKLKNTVQDAVGTVSSAVKDGTIRDALENAATAVKDGTVGDAVSAAVRETGDRVTGIVEAARGGTQEVAEDPSMQAGLAPADALRLFCYLMAADGKLLDDEIERFDEICAELAGDWAESERTSLIDSCQENLDSSSSSVSPLIPVITCVDRVLYSPTPLGESETAVSPRLLAWDLLAIAYGDGSCDAAERELIGHIVQIVGVDEAVVAEMESYVLTLLDIERETAWVKTTNQPYLAIEATVNDLGSRSAAVLEGAMSLINLQA